MKDLEKNVDSGSKATHPPILRIVRISLTIMKQSLIPTFECLSPGTTSDKTYYTDLEKSLK